MARDIKKIISEMTLEEKASLCSGLDCWHTAPVERLGVPSVMVSDGPHGLRKQDEEADHLGINESIKAVCFPPACLSACSFDRDLMEEFGKAIGKEAQAQKLSVVLGPAVCIKRSPLCGRNFEYYSEDPYLAGEVAAPFIRGVQSHHVGTSVKHFAANNQEFNRMSNSSDVDERTLREIYFPAFETSVKKADPYTIMCSYNRINGTFASENKWLLTDVLRKEWGFKGYVMSDWGAVNNHVEGLKAGLELEMPGPCDGNDAKIVAAVKDGSLDEAVVDQACERLLNIIFETYDNMHEEEYTLDEDHELAAKIAEESMVLLKNEDAILPLSQYEKVAFIGGFAEKPRFQGGGSSHINSYKVDSALESVNDIASITYAKGFPADKDEYNEALAQEAIAVAKEAEKVVIFAGLPDSFECEGYDRTHMMLPDCQNKLIGEILKVQKNVVIVLHNGSPVEMPWRTKVKGILEAYLGGQAMGRAVVRILYGQVNPSGKLAETIPLKCSDNPSYLNFNEPEHVNYAEGVFVGYRYYQAKEMAVAFPFGHGLSYTRFHYGNLTFSQDHLTEGETMTVSVDVTNVGNVPGKEVVQVYVADQTNAVRRPLRELKGFGKVALAPGETKTVIVELDFRSFAWYNTDLGDWYAASGMYGIQVGASSEDIRLRDSVQFTSKKLLPLHLDLNTTLGDLLNDPRTKEYGDFVASKLDAFFKPKKEEEKTAGDEAITEEMNRAMAYSMPLRNLVSFGFQTAAEIQETLDKLNQL